MAGSAMMIGWLYLPVAAGLGALHALEPGHGKTLMSLFLVGNKATIPNALTMGVVIGVTHTVVVAGLAIPAVLLTHYFDLEGARWWLALAGALGLCGLGLWMLVRETRALYTGEPSHSHGHGGCCGHEHDHGHGHTQEKSAVSLTQIHVEKAGNAAQAPAAGGGGLGKGEIFSLGFSAGLMPCPTAVAVLIAGLSTGQAVASFVTVVGFSVGVAGALSAVGIAVVLGGRYASGQVGKREGLKKAAAFFPAVSAAVVVLLGVFMLVRALTHAPEPIEPPGAGAAVVSDKAS